ncbi:Helix-turn-helix [Pseudomonas sp. B10]|nr:Helix-turn-helix [Pseudomonas sp. B10]
MSLRNALASVTQLLRTERGMSQQDLSVNITKSHVSAVENAKTSLTTDSLDELCKSLQLHPVAFLALVYAAQEQRSAADVITSAHADLSKMALLYVPVKPAPVKRAHPRVADAEKVTRAVQELKDAGHTRAEVARMLGVSEPTVRRHWNRPLA